MSIHVDVDTSEASKYFKRVLPAELSGALLSATNKSSSFLTTYIITRHLTGGTSNDRLALRSGKLAQSTNRIKAKFAGKTSVEGGVEFGIKYAKLHVSNKPKSTVITPKTAKMLAIPVPGSPAVTSSGVIKHTGSIRQAYPFLSRVGGLLVDKRNNNFTPYFALKKSVIVKSRVHLNDIANLKTEDIRNIFNKELIRILNL